MGRKHREAINIEALEHIDFLAQTGLDNVKIAKILNRSESNVRRYRKAIVAVRNGTAFDSRGNIGNISIKAVNEFARKHGFSDLIIKEPAKEEIPGQVSIEEYLYNNFAKENEHE